jgi:hypothetical protein
MRPGLRFLTTCVLVASSIALASDRNVPPPDKLMPKVAWSFAEPVPASVVELMGQLDAYAKSIKRKVDRRELQGVFPVKRLDIEYKYHVRRSSSGPWETLKVVARVKEQGTPLTYADILLQLHKASHKHLKEEDRHYFESLYLLERSFEPGVPAYEVYLGS